MSKRYIDADALKEECFKFKNDVSRSTMAFVQGQINAAPTADVVEVVRCRDCKHWYNEGNDMLINQGFGSCTCKYWEHPTEYFETAETDYCSYGERREDEP